MKMSSTHAPYLLDKATEDVRTSRGFAGKKRNKLMNMVDSPHRDISDRQPLHADIFIETKEFSTRFRLLFPSLESYSVERNNKIVARLIRSGRYIRYMNRRLKRICYLLHRLKTMKIEYAINPTPELRRQIEGKEKAIEEMKGQRGIYVPINKPPKRILKKKSFYGINMGFLSQALRPDLENNSDEALAERIRSFVTWVFDKFEFLDKIGAILPAGEGHGILSFNYTASYPGITITVKIYAGSSRKYSLPEAVLEQLEEEARLYQSKGHMVTDNGLRRFAIFMATITQVDERGELAITRFCFILLPKRKASSLMLIQLEGENWLLEQLGRILRGKTLI
jgi:hypothetical protein